MCGRYRLKDPKKAFEDLGYPEFSDIGPGYNISPTQRVFVLNSKREPEQVTWGFALVWT
jgi:putative SOS response-associated peptidase YedK